MRTFKIEVNKTLSKKVEVNENNLTDAILKAKEMYQKGKITLDTNDLVGISFIDSNAKQERDEMNDLVSEVIEYLYEDEKKHFEESEEPRNHIFLKLEKLKELIR